MAVAHVYSDLGDHLGPSPTNPQLSLLSLAYYGSLIDLCRQKVRLKDGMPLLMRMDNDEVSDLEVEGVARYMPGRSAMIAHTWVVEVDLRTMREVKVERAQGGLAHPCFGCEMDLYPHLSKEGLTDASTCPRCGLLVHTPFEKPAS